jgi:hypothetical protein
VAPEQHEQYRSVLRRRDLDALHGDLSDQLRAIMLMLTRVDERLEQLADHFGLDDEEEDHS